MIQFKGQKHFQTAQTIGIMSLRYSSHGDTPLQVGGAFPFTERLGNLAPYSSAKMVRNVWNQTLPFSERKAAGSGELDHAADVY